MTTTSSSTSIGVAEPLDCVTDTITDTQGPPKDGPAHDFFETSFFDYLTEMREYIPNEISWMPHTYKI